MIQSRGNTSLDVEMSDVEAQYKVAAQNANLLGNLLRTAHQHGAKQ